MNSKEMTYTRNVKGSHDVTGTVQTISSKGRKFKARVLSCDIFHVTEGLSRGFPIDSGVVTSITLQEV